MTQSFLTSAASRFLRYVTMDTQSDEQSKDYPSTAKQLVLLNQLVAELQEMGVTDATIDQYGYVMATIPATPGKEHVPVIGFIAGVTAPAGKRMGHAGAIISGGKGTAAEKLEVMEACGIKVTKNPAEMGKLLKSVLR